MLPIPRMDMDMREKVLDLLRNAQVAMLVTHDAGRLAARPMQIARVDPDARIWFLTGLDTHKAEEVAAVADVLVTAQDERAFSLSVRGEASLVRDHGAIRSLWREPYRTWFPGGVDDPTLVAISVVPQEAEYWDNRGTKGLKYAFEAASAYVKGHRPHVDEGDQHGRTRM